DLPARWCQFLRRLAAPSNRKICDGKHSSRCSSKAAATRTLQMSIATPSEVKPHRATEHPPFERITLLLQGGGALVSGPVPPPPREREAGFDWRCDVVDVGID